MGLKPYADEAATLRIGELTVENRLDRVSLWGSLDLTRDRTGLRRARELQGLLEAVVATLVGEGAALPETVEVGRGTGTVKNPFG